MDIQVSISFDRFFKNTALGTFFHTEFFFAHVWLIFLGWVPRCGIIESKNMSNLKILLKHMAKLSFRNIEIALIPTSSNQSHFSWSLPVWILSLKKNSNLIDANMVSYILFAFLFIARLNILNRSLTFFPKLFNCGKNIKNLPSRPFYVYSSLVVCIFTLMCNTPDRFHLAKLKLCTH